jgi:hypothetical protein
VQDKVDHHCVIDGLGQVELGDTPQRVNWCAGSGSWQSPGIQAEHGQTQRISDLACN